MWPDMKKAYAGDEYVVKIRDKEIRTGLVSETLSGTKIRKVALPRFDDEGELLKFLMRENVPGSFPYTAGVFAFKRENEDPTRMFAGEAKRLSTAFDSVTLYGEDPDARPDIYGKVGESGVSICTLDDMKILYGGFDLCSPLTSVSMTINGPAPMILAMYPQHGHLLRDGPLPQRPRPRTLRGPRPPTWRPAPCSRCAARCRRTSSRRTRPEHLHLLHRVRLRMMGDMQQYFIERARHPQLLQRVHQRVSHRRGGGQPHQPAGLHAGQRFHLCGILPGPRHAHRRLRAQPEFLLQQRLDPEYAVIGRVARRIWAIAMRDLYGANERSRMLKYHIQTSGRSLHSQEMAFNDIRTTLQALLALNDNCNSLHTNAYDEAVTTPTRESVRRALAIQMIINAWRRTRTPIRAPSSWKS
jgi:methylmalonyl-CoA mutase